MLKLKKGKFIDRCQCFGNWRGKLYKWACIEVIILIVLKSINGYC